jgi:hypothetical protein
MAPALVRPVSPQKVAVAVLRAVHRGGEILVASGPMRPLFALGELAPRSKLAIVRRLGIREVFRAEAQRLKQGADRENAAMRTEAASR